MMSRDRLSRRFLAFLSLCLLMLTCPLPAAAQEADPFPRRDPLALAARLLGFTGDPPVPPLTPGYQPGDTAEFWVGKGDLPTRVSATLAAVAPNVYLWVEAGIPTSGSLAQTAQQLSNAVTILRRSDNYRVPLLLPGIGALSDSSDLLPIADVDNDPHLFILYTTDLIEDRDAVINPIDSLPIQYAPYSNGHEMLYVNTTGYANTPLNDPIYINLIARGIYQLIMNDLNPQQPQWLSEALVWSLLFELQETQVDNASLLAFLQAPDTPLLQPETLTTRTQTLGAQQLFLSYFRQRYGNDPYRDLFMQGAGGIASLDAVLAARRIVDPVSGALITGRDAFADFAMTNIINIPFGDGRYVHSLTALPQGQRAISAELATQPSLTVSQFGTQYFRHTAARAETVTLRFTGAETVARLPMPFDRDAADRFYWSGNADDANPTLTRAVDLSGVQQATLSFDAWYDLAADWNYGYVSASTDDGATWTPLEATHTTRHNRNGAAYGTGFSGISNQAEPRPFPILGVVIGGDGVTISDIAAGGAAAQAGIRPGDVIAGYDSHEWTTLPNVLGLLEQYAPGETLSLYIQRGNERMDMPVLLGAHPTRIVLPEPLWLTQTVDLTPYAGQSILLRFETVTLPGYEDQGFAIDNIAIGEIGFRDDAEGETDGWTLNGWQALDNVLPQRWIVQAATDGTQTEPPRAQMLIGAHDNATESEWRFALSAGETLLVAVSGANDDTLKRASFALQVTSDAR